MNKSIYSILLAAPFLFAPQTHAQTKLKDGTIPSSSDSPVAGALLELESNNKGLLFSRVSLTATYLSAPLPAHTAGMVVYNTASVNDVAPGLYLNNGSKWQPLIKPSKIKPVIAGNGSQASSGWAIGEGRVYVVTMPVSKKVLATLRSSGLDPIVIDGVGIELANLADTTFIAPRFYNYSNASITLSMASLASFASGSQVKTNLTVKPGDFVDVDVDGLVWGTPKLVETELADLDINGNWYKVAWFVTTNPDHNSRTVRILVTRMGSSLVAP
ncbi:hypothetical protein NU688_07250 [Variovorax sp. ZS18.2.2]|uniref:hypothetical protein n=1 Tax=Variovorax sp. ZS18.2.2 TaxID=2971255 RepID=UPI00215186D9|nr:hypothetical protein [Variovorax sp. ZS18.2.2]MCR6475946.1 hypothetical protein [Variovorax sp. ZS18.2.2]